MVTHNSNVCVACSMNAEYTVWGPHPMKTYCYKHLVESQPEGYCYVYDKDWHGQFMVNGKLGGIGGEA